MNKQKSDELSAFALEMAKASEKATLAHFRESIKIDNKLDEGFDPVTAGDREAEQIMRQMIEKRYPGHSIHGEEFGKSQGSEPYTWVLDPIDGTRSFIAGTMTWTTLIGLEFEDKPVIGVMHQPYVGETFYGTPDGAWLLRGDQKRRLKVNPAPDLANAFGTTTGQHMYNTPAKAKFLNDMRGALRNIRYDADAYFFSLLAAGFIDIALDANLQAYDIAPLIPIIEGAGGIVSTWDGEPARLGGDIIAAASRELYEEALALLG
ncbi:Histidinol-phosphatase [alternative form] [hydrothermal vent metagenome]|uniref:Histidinol-phosphatase [alternative form] n=1 Tax=hydrothermal vent metagenome TaxID=652676 RepID=A0A3B0S428_9ZZZZ